jgi:hypothetical protein
MDFFMLCHCIQTSSGSHPSSYPVGTRGSFLGIRQLGHEADHSPLSIAKVKNAWSYTSAPPYAFLMCLVKYRGILTLTKLFNAVVIVHNLTTQQTE